MQARRPRGRRACAASTPQSGCGTTAALASAGKRCNSANGFRGAREGGRAARRDAARQLRMRFLRAPVALLPAAQDAGAVGGLRLAAMRLEPDGGGLQRAVATGEFEELEVVAVPTGRRPCNCSLGPPATLLSKRVPLHVWEGQAYGIGQGAHTSGPLAWDPHRGSLDGSNGAGSMRGWRAMSKRLSG